MKKIEADVVIDTNAKEWSCTQDDVMGEIMTQWEDENLDYYDTSCLQGDDFNRVYGYLIDDDHGWDDYFDFDHAAIDLTNEAVRQMTEDGVVLTDVVADGYKGRITAHAVLDDVTREKIIDKYWQMDNFGAVTAENLGEFLTGAYRYYDGNRSDQQETITRNVLNANFGTLGYEGRLSLASWCGSNAESELVEKAQKIAEEKDLDWVDVYDELFPEAYEEFKD